MPGETAGPALSVNRRPGICARIAVRDDKFIAKEQKRAALTRPGGIDVAPFRTPAEATEWLGARTAAFRVASPAS